MARISGFHPEGPGSTPGMGIFYHFLKAISSNIDNSQWHILSARLAVGQIV